MHASELIELAALVAVHGPVMVRGSKQISKANIEQYWVASKGRLDRWGTTLKGLRAEGEPQSGSTKQPPVRGVLEEIITGEVLTRVWAAAMCAYDRHRGTDFAEPLARSVLIGHMEARHRVLTLLVRGPEIDAELAVKLNRLRRRTERWADMLVGCLVDLEDVSEFAVDPDRAKDFADGLSCRHHQAGGRHARSLVLASLQAAFRHGLAPVSPNAEFNARIGEAVISCFPSELFDSTGVFRSAWLMRIASFTNDAQGMIEDLLGANPTPSPDDAQGTSPGRLSDRIRWFGS